MRGIKYILVILILLSPSLDALSQHLQGLTENQVIKNYIREHPLSLKSASGTVELGLPFFEDFSASQVVPDPAKWSDRYAFINSSFAIDPVSLGVATLDAIDENGEVYAITDFPVSSDTLTTHPFDLSPYTAPTDTVRLSFFYQAGGNGEVPELMDSLLLEFYDPAADRWNMAWYAITDTATGFQQVNLPVPQLYYQNGFRFRFRNYTSISAAQVGGGKGALSNADCWNIDYIMMNLQPKQEHESINDITLVDPPRELLDYYEIVPWHHLNDAQSITRNFMHFVLRNLEDGDSVNVGRSYYLRNIPAGESEFSENFFEQFGPSTLYRRNDPFIIPFTRRPEDSDEGELEVVAYLITPADQFKGNDTARITLNFKNFYAYDDGTPEYGFGISGESTDGALLAYRFRVFTVDTLRAVDMLFNKTRDNYNAGLRFRLCVWKDEGGLPGELLYQSPEEYSPGNMAGTPGFNRYLIDAGTDLVISDTVFYAGWKQVTDDFLNVGFDVNRNNLDKVFINISGDWFNPGSSIIPGSLMIRAVFGSHGLVTGENDLPAGSAEGLLYPNPVNERLYFRLPGTLTGSIAVFDLFGRMVLQETPQTDHIDVSHLAPGVYMVRITGSNGVVFSGKIVVSH
ncbi:MAG TPA: T9SS type A sorting domain-containing protein [Bacteroidales bacterium]|nr:T9SS type A sorting domain-containing protein [Bacteroidales bacterium]